MTTQTTQIQCPKCGEKINIEDVLAHQIEEKLKKDLNAKISALEKEYTSKQTTLEQKERELQLKSMNIQEQIDAQTKEAVKNKEQEIRGKLEKDYQYQIKSLSDETNETLKKLAELKNTQIENEKLKRQMELQKQNLELEFEQKMTERLTEEIVAIRTREADRVDLKIKELEKKIKRPNRSCRADASKGRTGIDATPGRGTGIGT